MNYTREEAMTERPNIKDYQTKAFHNFDMESYSKDLDKYIDGLVKDLEVINRHVACGWNNSACQQIGDLISKIQR